MNNITNNTSEIKTAAATANKQKDVETTGSIASNNIGPLFDIPMANYDMFIPTNPFSLNIDFGSYAEESNQSLANNSTFMQGWASAMAALSECGFSSGSFGGAAGASIASGYNGGGSCSMGGGFTSVG